MHNRKVDETTEGSGRVRELDMDYLRTLNAAARWSNNPAFQHIPIPTLAEVILLLQTHRTMRANIEIKPCSRSLGLTLGERITEAGLQDRVLIASASYRVLKKFRKQYVNIATSASVLEIILFKVLSKIGFSYRPNTDAIQWHSKFWKLKIITRKFVERARRRGLIVHAWTVNEPEEMGRMIALGVDGIITDYPRILMQILKLKDLEL